MLDPNIDPNENIAKTFGAQRQQLLYQKKAAQEQADQDVARQQAVSGFSGGTALKAKQNAATKLEDSYNSAQAGLTAQEAGAKQQESQFARTFGLSQQQFEESKNQFKQQMQYQWSELDENKKTNLINTYIALDKAHKLDFGLGGTRFQTELPQVKQTLGSFYAQ